MRFLFSIAAVVISQFVHAQTADSIQCGTTWIKAVKECKPSYNNISPALQLPKITTPQGAVFCRMEDFMTRKTKVWVKVGVK